LRRVVFFLGVFLLLSSCSVDPHLQPSEKGRIASEIRSQTARKLEAEMGLIPFGFGGQMMGQIERLCLTFQYRHPVNIENARRILVQAGSKFMNEINSNEKVRQYLSNYPFEPKNIEIKIVLKKTNGSKVEKGELALIALRDGMLQYNFNDSDYSFKTIEETYEQALEKLQF
jgi:hypothetical protein